MKKFMKIFLGAILFLIIAGIFSGVNEADPVTTEEKAGTTETAAEPKEEKVDKKPGKAEFDQVKSGMTLEQVEAILGKGSMDAESETNGIKVQMYSWDADGDFGANITVSFTNGKADVKSQFGLE